MIIQCNVTTTEGNNIVYEYKKNLPYDVIEKDCTVEVETYFTCVSSLPVEHRPRTVCLTGHRRRRTTESFLDM